MRWLWAWVLVVGFSVQGEPMGVDNAGLMPRLEQDAEVGLEEEGSPDWVKSLIMVQFRIETATREGTFAAAERVLDHYARMGVNGLWINPIYERGSRGNGYLNFGPRAVEPLLAGGGTREEGWAAARRFVEAAHGRNMRVFWDVVVWGTAKDAPLVREHPEFYARDDAREDGAFREVWGGYAFDWGSEAFRAWFEEAAVAVIENTGADGFRIDLAPDISGDFFGRVRRRLLRAGRKIALISEMPNERRDVFDFEQTGVTGWTEQPDWADAGRLAEQRQRFGLPHDYFLTHNVVDAIRTGRGIGSAVAQQRGGGGGFRFYTANLLCHDDAAPAARGNRVRFAYGTLFTPMIPMWWIGEEWDNPRQPLPDPRGTGVMYFNTIDWAAAARERNARFLEDIKAMIRIRRSYPEIFERFPARVRDAAIAKVVSRLDGAPNPLQAYARFAGGRAILIVPNLAETEAHAEVDLEPEAWGLKAEVGVGAEEGAGAGAGVKTKMEGETGTEGGTRAVWRVTDLLRGRVLADERAGERAGGRRLRFTDVLPGGYLGVYLVEGMRE